jgi:GT2 family glycosyltransferase
LEYGIAAFNDAAIGGVGGRVMSYPPKTLIERYQTDRDTLGQEKLLTNEKIQQKKATIITCNAFYRRSIFDMIGLFEQSILCGGDYDFSLRLQSRSSYRLAYCPGAVVFHKHRTNIRDFWKQYKKYGYGRIHLARTHKRVEFEKRIMIPFYKQVYWQLKGVQPEIRKLINYILKIGIKERNVGSDEIAFSVLDLVAKCAYLWGSIESAHENRTPYLDSIF